MKKKFLGMFATFAFMWMIPIVASAASAPTVEDSADSAYASSFTADAISKGYINFFANGTPITIEAREGGAAGVVISWEGDSVELEGSYINIFGGSHNANVESTSITMNGGDVRNLFGGGLHASVVGDAEIVINEGSVASYVVGGGASSASWTNCHRPWYAANDENAINKVESASVIINGGKIGLVFGGGEGQGYVGETSVLIEGGTIGYATAGGSNGLTGMSSVLITGGEIDIYQGVNRGVVESADTVVAGGKINKLYVGGEVVADGSVNGTLEASVVAILAGEVGTLEKGTSGGQTIDFSATSNNDPLFAVVKAEGSVKTDNTNGEAVELVIKGLDKEKVSMKIGDKLQLKATIDPSTDDVDTDNSLVIWSSSDESVVAVDGLGNLTAKKAGKATISAQLGKTTITCEVTVEPTKESKLDDVPKTSNTLPIALIALVVLAAGTGVYSLRTAKSNK